MNDIAREATIAEKRIAVAHVLEERLKADLVPEEPESDFDAWMIFQNEMLRFAVDVLLEPKKYLSYSEITEIFEERQHEYDVLDIENELDMNGDYYAEKFNIDETPISKTEIESMANKLRELLDENADAEWSESKTVAVMNILSKRKPISVGDRVKVYEKELPNHLYGTEGTVKKAGKTPLFKTNYYAVELDKKGNILHDCAGNTKNHHGWYCEEADLAPTKGESK